MSGARHQTCPECQEVRRPRRDVDKFWKLSTASRPMLRPITPLRLSICLDRVGRNEPATREEAGANCEGVGHVRLGAVHRSFDPADDTAF